MVFGNAQGLVMSLASGLEIITMSHKDRDDVFGDLIYEPICEDGDDCNGWTCECAMRDYIDE